MCRNTFQAQSRGEVLELLNRLVNLNIQNLRLCVTSLPEIDIQHSLSRSNPYFIDLYNHKEQQQDIATFVQDKVHSEGMMQRWPEAHKERVIKTLTDKADGG
jgi:hypothetical protein